MNLQRWQHGALALLILLAIIVLVLSAIVSPVVKNYQERKEDLAVQQDRLNRYLSVSEKKDKLIPFYRRQLAVKSENASFLPEMAPSVAAANLQQKVKTLLDEQQGQLISTQPVPTQAEDFVSPVMIRIHMKSDLPSFFYTLHALESSQPSAFIENIQIQRVGGVRQNSQPRSNPLDIHFNLKVYMLNN